MSQQSDFQTTVLKALEQQSAFQEQQSAFLEQQSAFQEQQAKQAESRYREQQHFQKTVLEKLANIEKDVLVIKGVVVSDFAGVSPSTKAELEEEVVRVDLTSEDIEDFRQLYNDNTSKGVAFRRHINNFSTGKVLLDYNLNATKGEKAACGNWVGNIMTKLYNLKFGGKYPEMLRPIVALLVGYYATERISARLY